MEGTEDRMPATLPDAQAWVSPGPDAGAALMLYDEPTSVSTDHGHQYHRADRESEERGSTAVVAPMTLHLLQIADRVLMIHEGEKCCRDAG